MPPKKVTVVTLPAGQQSIQFLFKKPSRGGGSGATNTKTAVESIVGSPDIVTIPAAAAAAAAAAASAQEAENPEPSGLTYVRLEADPSHIHISAFYASLGPTEKIAHAIAVEKLGTSYDVTRTHGFLKWKKTLK